MAKRERLEHELLKVALETLEQEIGIKVTVQEIEAKIDEKTRVDALLRLEGVKKPIGAEIKNWAQHKNLGAVINQVKRLPIEGVLIADYVNPIMATKLRNENVQFIDTVGNAYINMLPTYVFVKGNRPNKNHDITKDLGANTPVELRTTGRAFQPTGMKVGYIFLCYPEMLNAPYREIAKAAHVAVGTVGWVMTDLRETGLLLEKGDKKEKIIVDRKKYFDRWIENYPAKLKPKIHIDDFRTNNINWWRDINIGKYDALWGGEVAADKLTNYLKPEKYTIYINKDDINKIIVDGKLFKGYGEANENINNKNIDVTLMDIFWKQMDLKENYINNFDTVVNPILVYADLIETGETRNLETANKIYEKYIAKYL